MSIEQSKTRQKNIETLKICIQNAIDSNIISNIVLLEFPKWSIYYKDGDSCHSTYYDCFTNASVYKLLKFRL